MMANSPAVMFTGLVSACNTATELYDFAILKPSPLGPCGPVAPVAPPGVPCRPVAPVTLPTFITSELLKVISKLPKVTLAAIR